MCNRPTFRILDANINRAREAIRLVEDYCRFCLDNKDLATTAKAIRHQLTKVTGRLPAADLLACRDVEADVGIGLKVEGQMTRTALEDCLVAGCKRLTEALRVIAETSRTIDQQVADTIEQLRYRAYALERQIALFVLPGLRFADVCLYVIINANYPGDILSLVASCIEGGADCIQLRCKYLPDNEFLALADRIVAICRKKGALSIINDRVDIAVATGADGLHLGRQDLPPEKVRLIQHRPLILGMTTHNHSELDLACRQQPTYVSLGPVFPTPTKPDLPVAGLEYVRQAIPKLSGTGIYHLVIGGINMQNIDQALDAGAKAVAISSAIISSSDPGKICTCIKHKIRSRQA